MYTEEFRSYHVNKRSKDNINDSNFEEAYKNKLDRMLKAGEILNFRQQVRLELEVNGYIICDYKTDFIIDHLDGTHEIVETKGLKGEMWRFKWRLLEAIYCMDPDFKLTVISQRKFKPPVGRKIKSIGSPNWPAGHFSRPRS